MRHTARMACGTVAALLLVASSLAWTHSALALDNSVTGTFSCNCEDTHGDTTSGTCTVTNYTRGIKCSKEATDTCAGQCVLTSTTTGAAPAARARAKKAAKGLSAPVQAK
jgi:hypothetical protein